MNLSWDGAGGFVEMAGRRHKLVSKPFLPFQFDTLEFDDWQGIARLTFGGEARQMTEAQAQLCLAWITDAFDGGIAGT